jgi:hypothetical protein
VLSHNWPFQALSDFAAVLIGLHRDALNVHPRGRHILVIERFLRLDETAGFFCDYPRVGVPSLMQVDILDARAAFPGTHKSRAKIYNFVYGR